MIKSIYLVRLATNEAEFNALQDFFSAIGLERAESWQGQHNRGALFRTPQAGIEVGLGGDFPRTDLVCEVADADSAYELVKKRGFKIAEEIAERRWGGRMFLVEAAPGQRVAIFSYLPEKKPRHQAWYEGATNAAGLRFGIVVSRFNSFITERLMEGALDGLHRSGARDEDITILRVPGAFEIPAAARALAESGRVDAVICIGCIIRGETSHYEHIATEVTRGIGQSAQETGVPHAYGVLTCENLEQAIDRAGLKAGNKGFEAAMAAIEMASLKTAVGGQTSAVSRKST
ncbi:MAG: 6,7-dimethyl-8-ribityllumazine synthase [Terriglobales bacterium]